MARNRLIWAYYSLRHGPNRQTHAGFSRENRLPRHYDITTASLGRLRRAIHKAVSEGRGVFFPMDGYGYDIYYPLNVCNPYA